MDKEKIYQIAIDTRNFEIQLFWQRSNYFLVLNTAIAVGLFSVKEPVYAVILGAFGVVTSFLWFRVNLGSKYWQSRWEHRASTIEKQLGANVELFSATKPVLDQDVRLSLINNKESAQLSLYGYGVMSKPSVSKAMAMLSISFIGLWSCLLGLSLGKWLWP